MRPDPRQSPGHVTARLASHSATNASTNLVFPTQSPRLMDRGGIEGRSGRL